MYLVKIGKACYNKSVRQSKQRNEVKHESNNYI